LVVAPGPRSLRAAASYARAACSGVSKVPSHTRAFLTGSRISAAYRPHGRFRTPRSLGCSAAAASNTPLPLLPAGDDDLLGAMDDDGWRLASRLVLLPWSFGGWMDGWLDGLECRWRLAGRGTIYTPRQRDGRGGGGTVTG